MTEPDLPGIAARIEASLARQLASEQFVTAIFAQIPADASKAVLLNCGHPPPLLANAADAQFAPHCLTQLNGELLRHVGHGHPLTDDAAMLLIRRATQPAP